MLMYAASKRSRGMVSHLLRDFIEAVILAAAILAPWALLRPPVAPDLRLAASESIPEPEAVRGAAGPSLEGRVEALEAEIDRALEPYRWKVIRAGGGARPEVRRVTVRD